MFICIYTNRLSFPVQPLEEVQEGPEESWAEEGPAAEHRALAVLGPWDSHTNIYLSARRRSRQWEWASDSRCEILANS